MVTIESVLKELIDVKNCVVEGIECIEEHDQLPKALAKVLPIHMPAKLLVHIRPQKRQQRRCPICGKKCPGYDQKRSTESWWRAPNLSGIPVVLLYRPTRIQCPRHGVLTERLPWQDGNSRFTAAFNNEIAWMAGKLSTKDIAEFFGISWKTAGHCIKATLNRLEPDHSVRLNGLKRICVDETSYRKGHLYITVVYDMDRNQTVWVEKGHGYGIFKQFCELLTEEQRNGIEMIAGDGADWITTCKKEYFPNAVRAMDPFHVTQWLNEALDEIRIDTAKKAKAELDSAVLEKTIREQLYGKTREEVQQGLAQARSELARILQNHGKAGRKSNRQHELEEYITAAEALLGGSHDTIHTDGKDRNSAEAADSPQKAEEKSDRFREETERRRQAAQEELDQIKRERAGKRGRKPARVHELEEIVKASEDALNADPAGQSAACQEPSGGLSGQQTAAVDLSDLEKRLQGMKDGYAAIRGGKYPLGKNPENLTQNQAERLALIQASYPDVGIAYSMKESLRVLLHSDDPEFAKRELKTWIDMAQSSGLKPLIKVGGKIGRNQEYILASITYGGNSAKSEATNTSIKCLIKIARGFRNIENLKALVYLRCSALVVPLQNRIQDTAEEAAAKRKHAAELKKRRKAS